MERIEKSIEVGRPIRVVYNQWTQFEEFPRFMSGVKEVRQLDDTHVHWHAEIWGRDKEWDAEITEQVPDERISWKSISGASTAGTVRFEPVGPERTLVRVIMAYEPEGAIENVGDALGVMRRQLGETVEDFKEFIEDREYETGAWRGTVKGSRKQETGNAPGHAAGGENLASSGSTGATGGSRGTAGTGGAAYTNPGGSTAGQEGQRGHLPGHATGDVPNDAWPFKQDVKKP